MYPQNRIRLSRNVQDFGIDNLRSWIQKNGTNLLSITTFAMQIVEKLKTEENMSPDIAYLRAKELIPEILQSLATYSLIDSNTYNYINQQLVQGTEVIDQIIPLAISISNNPQLIQATKYGKDKLTGCMPCFGSTTKATKKKQLPAIYRTAYY